MGLEQKVSPAGSALPIADYSLCRCVIQRLCLRKEEYLEAIEAVGFQSVKTLEEQSFPVDFIYAAFDLMAKEVGKDLLVIPEIAREFAGSVVSIKVSGVKLD